MPIHLSFEGELDGLEGVVLGVGDVDGERAAGVGAAVGAIDDHLPVEQVRHGRRAGPAERRRVHPELFQLLADPPDHRGRLWHGRCRRSCAPPPYSRVPSLRGLAVSFVAQGNRHLLVRCSQLRLGCFIWMALATRDFGRQNAAAC